jgi:hypothetical protein
VDRFFKIDCYFGEIDLRFEERFLY